MPFLFLNFLWHLWRFRVHNSFYSCLVISMGNFGYESFFVEKCDKKWRKLELFRFFFCFFETSFLDYYDLSIVLRASGCSIGCKDFFVGFICFCNIKKFTNFFQFFSAGCFN